MARLPQSIEPGVVYHLISRFVAKEWFIQSDEERRRYLKLLGDHVVDSVGASFRLRL